MNLIDGCSVDICLCTYKRPHLLKKTLDSLFQMDVERKVALTVIVVDNDSKESARNIVELYSRQNKIDIRYITEGRQNISLARNAALAVSTADVIVFVDDDEVVAPDWLTAHLWALDTYKADVILGPVNPIYNDDTPLWIIKGGFFERLTREEATPLNEAASGNTSMRRTALPQEGDFFSEEFGLTGGGDYEFFGRLSSSGEKIVWSNKPVVCETVQQNRCTITWLVKRAYRTGQGHSRIHQHEQKTSKLVINGVTALAAFFLCILLLPFGKEKWVTRLRQSSWHLGIITAASGRYFQEYKD